AFGQTDRLSPHGSQDERSSPVTIGIRAFGSKALLGCRKKLLVRDRVVTLEESMGDVKERIDDVDDRHNDGLRTLQEQLREFVWDTIGSSENKLAGKDDAHEAMVTALKEEIDELKGELKIFKAAIGNGMLASKPKSQVIDVPKPKAFKRARSASEMENFLWAMRQYFPQFYPEYAEDKARAKLQQLTQRGTVREYVREFSELMLQISDLSENEAFFSFTDRLKPWAKQELQRRGVQELTNAMMVAESIVELVPRRDKLSLLSPIGGAMVGTMRRMKRDTAIMAT
ncbi:hypothetical protein Gohar_021604, partial [Gossypium harknessii]|nr:hypothetical protein [Gossypium harknessii]